MTNPAHTLAATETDSPSAARARGRARGSRVPPEGLLITFAVAAVRRELDALVGLRPEPHAQPTPEEIHQLRVAARRLRVALRLFRRMLPSRAVARLRVDLRWFASALGAVRDLDVYVDNFHGYAEHVPAARRQDLAGYELYLNRERAQAHTKLAALFTNPRYSALFAVAAKFLREGPEPGALRRWQPLSVADGSRESLRRSLRRVRRLGNRLHLRSRPTEFHALRIGAKRLRYELEFFADAYPPLKALAKATKALQETLGQHQDATAAGARLRRYAASLRHQTGVRWPLPPALDDLRRGQLKRAREIRAAFAAEWQRFLAVVTDASVASG